MSMGKVKLSDYKVPRLQCIKVKNVICCSYPQTPPFLLPEPIPFSDVHEPNGSGHCFFAIGQIYWLPLWSIKYSNTGALDWVQLSVNGRSSGTPRESGFPWELQMKRRSQEHR